MTYGAIALEVMVGSQETKKPICDKNELLAAVENVMQDRKRFTGKTRDLLKLLGDGSWNACPNQLRGYLRKIHDNLAEKNIRLDLSDEKQIVLEAGGGSSDDRGQA